MLLLVMGEEFENTCIILGKKNVFRLPAVSIVVILRVSNQEDGILNPKVSHFSILVFSNLCSESVGA